MPDPEPPRKILPSRVFQSRIESIVSSHGEDEAGAALRLLLEADVEPDGRVERRHLVQQDVGQLGLEGVPVLGRGEVAALATPVGDRARDARDHLLDRALARRRVQLSAEVLLGDDVGRVLRPRRRELDVRLVERDLVPVTDLRVPQSPTPPDSNGWTPGCVNTRRTEMASPARGAAGRAVCGVCSTAMRKVLLLLLHGSRRAGSSATPWTDVCGSSSVPSGPDGRGCVSACCATSPPDPRRSGKRRSAADRSQSRKSAQVPLGAPAASRQACAAGRQPVVRRRPAAAVPPAAAP